MLSFLTLEDVNGVLAGNNGFYWHEINTANISSTNDFTDVKYDFVEVSRETLTGDFNGYFLYTFKFHINNWSLGYYSRVGNSTAFITQTSSKIQFRTNKAYCSLFLYMGNLQLNNVEIMRYSLIDEVLNLNLKELNTPQTIHYKLVGYNNEYTMNVNLVKGYNSIVETDWNTFVGYLLVNLVKTDFTFNCNPTLKLGKVNKVLLGTDADYKPNGDLVGSYTPTIKVHYANQVIPVTWSSTDNDYIFNLDLTDITDPQTIDFKITIDANTVLNHTETEYHIRADYTYVSNITQFKQALANKVEIIRINSTIQFDNEEIINIDYDVSLIGMGNNRKEFLLREGSIRVKTGTHLIMENIEFINGLTAIIQEPQTQLDLTNCRFTDCYNRDNKGLGGSIYCEGDYDGLNDPTDFITNINNCEFSNWHSITHNGILNINNSRFIVTYEASAQYMNTDYPAFLYQVDGTATVTNSLFKLQNASQASSETILCSNHDNADFLQCLFLCGENATINTATHESLKEDNGLPFFDEPYNNRSYLFMKYYYPQISECVISSPLPNYEDKCLCYGVTGVDWVYKQNVQITTVASGLENNVRRI